MTKNDGTSSTARQVDATMPENTVMPIEARALAPAPVASTSGDHAENEGKRGHQDRTEARAGRLHRRLRNRFARLAQFAREFDDEDRVLRRQRDQQHDADLRVEIVVDAERDAACPPGRPARSAPPGSPPAAGTSFRIDRRGRDRRAAAPSRIRHTSARRQAFPGTTSPSIRRRHAAGKCAWQSRPSAPSSARSRRRAPGWR